MISPPEAEAVLAVTRNSMRANGGQASPVFVVGFESETNVLLVGRNPVRTSPDGRGEPIVPAACLVEGSTTDDLGAPRN